MMQVYNYPGFENLGTEESRNITFLSYQTKEPNVFWTVLF